MFDITQEDIKQLNDVDLRELVGRLCEAELVNCGLSAAAVTWGGSQTAADGGLDVCVALPSGASIEGFVPRPSTGFQVKMPDMPRAAILAEMRPTGMIRPVIQALANEGGAYIIVSSKGSTTESALGKRRNALREALNGMDSADKLHTDFYDGNRLASWVRRHPGLITWVKERVGRALIGWRPYGPWSGTVEGADAEYLLDDKLRLHLGRRDDVSAKSVARAIDELRDELAKPGKIVRLVGLSGVGKTRLAQALFDARIGARPLPPSLAVYTNLSDNPDPQPIGLASDLTAMGMRAVLIVDNCPQDLHRRLCELCGGQASTLSVLTVEYDVRDDHPEGTQVVTLDVSSPELIEKLVRRRFPHLSQVDARTLAEASGGNARIAILLAETVERSDTIAGLSNDELFQRLFWQRQHPDEALLRAAQACSLVYSFKAELVPETEAELPHLAMLAEQTGAEIYRHVAELIRRDLVQQRGVWRAVLPHAVANRLAARGLEDTPYDLINQYLVEGGTERLAKSFSRRLSFLHDHPKAVAIVEKWLAPGGLLGDVKNLNELGQAMFENVAPVLPETTLAAIERANTNLDNGAMMNWRRQLFLLRSLAYDPLLFERSAKLLARAATQSMDEGLAKTASDVFVSLFTIYLSGTHATIEQRLNIIDSLLRSGEPKARTLGLAALNAILETKHFSSTYQFEFGARSRDFGYQPQSKADVLRWYGGALSFVERAAFTEGVLKPELRDLIARNFRGLWTSTHMHDDLERLFRKFAADGFWREGWVACRETLHFSGDRLPPEIRAPLSTLESDLRPSNLQERVRAMVLGARFVGLDLEEMDISGDAMSAIERLETVARDLGAAVAVDDRVFTALLPDLLRGGRRVWAFGCGLASASPDLSVIWTRLIEGLEKIAPEQRDVEVLRGFLAELWRRDRNLAEHLLDSALDQSVLLVFLPNLHSAIELNERGVERLKRALIVARVPVRRYRDLAFGRATRYLSGGILKDLLLLIADQPDGLDVALDMLHMRLHWNHSAEQKHEPELLEVGRELLQRATFCKGDNRDDYNLAKLVKTCLTNSDGDSIAAVAMRLRQAVMNHETHSFDNHSLLSALLEVQPMAALNALFSGEEEYRRAGVRVFEQIGEHHGNPADVISREALIAWCDEDRELRYPLAASIITFARRPEPSGSKVWSEQAAALLVNAPDPRSLLAVFIRRFRPKSWSGSRAALIEANARLLDGLESIVASDLMPFVADAKAQLAQTVAQERQWETKNDQAQDERFE